MRHDITFPLYVEVDEIFNLACPASPVHYQHDPVQTTKVSVHGAINMLGLAKRLKAKDPAGLDAARCTAIPSVHPQVRRATGATSIRSGRAPATTKASAAPRRCSSTTTASIKLPIKVARIFNTYGPRMHPNDGRVVSNFIVQALRGEPITILRRRQPDALVLLRRRSRRGLLRLMTTPTDVTGPINLGNPNEFTMLRARRARHRARPNSKSKIVFQPLPQDDPRRRKPDIALAREKLDWQPHVQLQDGLSRTIAYFDALLRGCAQDTANRDGLQLALDATRGAATEGSRVADDTHRAALGRFIAWLDALRRDVLRPPELLRGPDRRAREGALLPQPEARHAGRGADDRCRGVPAVGAAAVLAHAALSDRRRALRDGICVPLAGDRQRSDALPARRAFPRGAGADALPRLPALLLGLPVRLGDAQRRDARRRRRSSPRRRTSTRRSQRSTGSTDSSAGSR